MLIILFGVSGVGKTSIIEYLIEKNQYKPVRVFTTRELREKEKIKIHLSNEQFKEMFDSEEFMWVNEFFGSLYGTSKMDVMMALNSSERFILDYSLKCFNDVENISCYKIIVKPESIESLKKQIILSKRSDRLDEAIHDYTSNYSEEILKRYKDAGGYVVTNFYKKLEQTINDIKMIIEEE